MILTVSPHAMWGLKASTENDEKLSQDTIYEIILDSKTKPTYKKPNKCYEFINKDIQNWIIENAYNIYDDYNPPKFSAILISENIIKIKGRITK